MWRLALLPPLLALLLGNSSRAFGFPSSLALQRRTASLSSAATTQLRSVTIDTSAARSGSRKDDEDSSSSSSPTSSFILKGKSPKVVRLRQTLQDVWSNPSTAPIVILGPKGSGKPSIVNETLRNLPSWQTQTVHRLDLDNAVDFVETMLGTDSQEGLLDLMASQLNATLVLKGFDSLHCYSEGELEKRQTLQAMVEQLLVSQTFHSRMDNDKEKKFAPRIIYTQHTTSSSADPTFLQASRDTNNQKNRVLVVKIPGLDARAQDMAEIVAFKLEAMKSSYGLRNSVILTKEANHRLLDHTWTNGEFDLDEELQKALLRLTLETKSNPYLVPPPGKEASPFLLEPRHLFVEAPDESMRRRLLYDFPWLRKVIQSPWIFDHFQRYIVAPVFIGFLLVLFAGPQTRDQSAALTVFWAGWWPAVMLSFPFLGRIWCSICPFMVVGELARDAVTALDVWKLKKKWPKFWTDTWGAPFAFGLFFAILMWEELWNLPQNGALSAWLLLLITSGAVFNSIQFEKRLWCRHMCPIGAMTRTFGTMSMTEVRSFKANCQGCTNPQCVNGDSTVPSPTDTFALKGCTMGIKNNQLTDMGHCTLCMSCVKNCDKETPEVNLRPVGLDYGLPWLLPPVFQDRRNMAISQVETNYWMGALLTVLQGSVLVHYMPTIFADVGIDPAIALAPPALDSDFCIHTAATALLLALPGLLSLFVDRISVPLESTIEAIQATWGSPVDEKQMTKMAVVDAYEAILQSDKSLEATLEELDPDGDGRIAYWEFERVLNHLAIDESERNILLPMVKNILAERRVNSLPAEVFLDVFQSLYLEARGVDTSLPNKLQLETTKTFVELFNELDQDEDGFILPGDFDRLIDREFGFLRTWEDKLELFRSADVVGQGRLNLFEFMTIMRKIAKAGIQEIGYGYLPLAWGSLTAYWAGVGLRELGLTLARLPDTFYLGQLFSGVNLPGVSASDGMVALVQSVLVIGSLPLSIGLTQKLCSDFKISGLRFGLHAGVQVVGAWITLYLMLSSNPLVA